MRFKKVRPALISVGYGKSGIEIAVSVLSCGDEIYKLISLLLQGLIRCCRQRISCRFEPFPGIAILKNHSVKITMLLTSQRFAGIDEIGEHAAFFSTCFISHNSVLIRYHLTTNKFLITADKSIALVCTYGYAVHSFQNDHLLCHLKVDFFAYMYYNLIISIKK